MIRFTRRSAPGASIRGSNTGCRFSTKRLETLFDYLPDAHESRLDDQMTPARLARWDTHCEDQYDTRGMPWHQNPTRIDTVYKPCAAGAAVSGTMRRGTRPWIADRRGMQFSPLPQATGPGVIDAGGRIGRNFAPERQQENISLFGIGRTHIRAKSEVPETVLMAAYSEGARRTAGRPAGRRRIWPGAVDGRRVLTGSASTGLHLAVWALEHGFETPDMTVIAEQDVLGDRLIRVRPQAPQGRKLS